MSEGSSSRLLDPRAEVTAVYRACSQRSNPPPPHPRHSHGRYGTLNIHPSLLPRYRGASPVQRTLEAGDPETGVSVLFTVLKMDAGPIVWQVGLGLATMLETLGDHAIALALGPARQE
jgi:hypothetical protein